jgi:tRNA modification GTPase
MKKINSKTIVALATAKGVGAIAVIRISGEQSYEIINKIFRAKSGKFGEIINDVGEIIDQVIVTGYHAPRSYTGEDLVEISCHGSPFVAGRIINLILSNGAETAAPGEFTLRAFLNGKMDLVQAEAVSSLIVADTERARHAAILQLEGHLSARINVIRDKLISLLATIETQIDFSEEELPPIDRIQLLKSVNDLLSEIRLIINTYNEGKVIRDGFRVALIGPPNAGKSSIFNALCNSERVIVDEHPGTTRDSVEETISIDGYRITIIDTAGIRDTEHKIENIGIERAKKVAEESDLILNIIDTTEPLTNHAYINFITNCNVASIEVFNKCDLSGNKEREICVSALTGSGIDTLKKSITAAIPSSGTEGEGAIMTSARQQEALRKTKTALSEMITNINSSGEEILAQYLRVSINSIGAITGHTTDDDILNHIFSNFCIGK